MEEIAILFKVPVVVFKCDRTFDHYKIVDVAFYESGGLNRQIVMCLLQSCTLMIIHLIGSELGESKRWRAHIEYETIYNSSFAKPSE